MNNYLGNNLLLGLLVLTVVLISSGIAEQLPEQSDEELYDLSPFSINSPATGIDDPDFLAHQLSKYKLEPISENGEMRFLWIRTSSEYPVFQFVFNYSDAETIRFQVLEWIPDEVDDEEGSWELFKEKSFSSEVHESFLNGLEENYHFFSTPSLQGTDHHSSSIWIIEIIKDEKKHWVRRASPHRDSDLFRLGLEFILISIDSPLMPVH